MKYQNTTERNYSVIPCKDLETNKELYKIYHGIGCLYTLESKSFADFERAQDENRCRIIDIFKDFINLQFILWEDTTNKVQYLTLVPKEGDANAEKPT